MHPPAMMPRFLLAFLIACGGGSSEPPLDAAPDTTFPDGPDDAQPVDAQPVDAHPVDAQPMDAGPDAPSTNPAIDSVMTSAGATETRQDAEAHLVIAGRNLQATSQVTVGATVATIDSATATEVRVTLYVPAVVGPQPVTLVAAAGTVTRPDAIEVTPFVISPGASGGLGTYRSPLGLCDPELELAGPGDTIELQGGTHTCGRWVNLNAGVTVAGAAGTTAIARGTAEGGFGFAVLYGPDTEMTTVRDLTFDEPLAPVSVDLSVGTLVVQRVRDHGGLATYDRDARIADYFFEGPGPALEASGAVQLVRAAIDCTSGEGISVGSGGSVTLDDVTVRRCATGLWVHGTPTRPAAAVMAGCDFIDNHHGIRITHGSATISGTTVQALTPAASSIGLWVDTADVFVSTTQIIDQGDVGVLVTSPVPNNGIDDSLLDARGIEIVRGRVGISYENMDNNFWLRSSTIRDQTEAALRCYAVDSQTDLGRAGDPGHNVLSVTSGFAIDDRRSFESGSHRYIYANGTTLNGQIFDGEAIEGPAELAPHYRITSADSGIQF